MSSVVVCPDCKKQLKVPETMRGKAFRCPACKAVISSPSKSRSTASDSESDEEDTPSPSCPVKTVPSGRAAPPASRSRSPREEEPEDDLEVVDEKPIRAKSPRKRRPIRKKSSAGLIVGLVAGGAALLILLAVGGGLVWILLRSKTIPESEWQAFAPPNSGCTVLMPGTPESKTLNIVGITMTQYEVNRKKEDAYFGVATFDVPPQSLRPNLLEDVAKGARDGGLARVPGSVVTSETSISLRNLPGREYQVKLPKGMFIGRVYLAKVGNTHRVYQVVAGGTNLQPNKGDAARFFDSFKIDASATPPTLAAAAGESGAQPPLAQPPANPQPNVPPGIPGPRFPRRPRP